MAPKRARRDDEHDESSHVSAYLTAQHNTYKKEINALLDAKPFIVLNVLMTIKHMCCRGWGEHEGFSGYFPFFAEQHQCAAT